MILSLEKKVDGLPLNEFRVLGEKCSARWKFRILNFRIFHQYIFTNFIISSIFWYKYVHNFLHSSIPVIQIKENNYRSIISVLLINSKGGSLRCLKLWKTIFSCSRLTTLFKFQSNQFYLVYWILFCIHRAVSFAMSLTKINQDKGKEKDKEKNKYLLYFTCTAQTWGTRRIEEWNLPRTLSPFLILLRTWATRY